ncbi:MAG: hypothetical protein K2R93_02095 [Gemmatimonadaceae bacterium]|nr:hypothetical protein [Gemmatimonadaceae bacterium]
MTRRLRVTPLVAIFSLVASGAPLSAQTLDTIRVEQRLRVRRTPSMQRITGTLVAQRGDTLVVQTDAGYAESLLIGSLTDVQRSRGRTPSGGVRRGVLWGMGVGLLGGGAGIAMGGAVGAGLGAVIGGESWTAAVLPSAPVAPAVPAATPVAAATPTAAPVAATSAATPILLADRPLLVSGQVVRFATPTTKRVLGTVAAVERDSLRITNGAAVTAYDWAGITRLERYAGRTAKGGGRRGGKIGAIIGTVSLGVMGAAIGGWGGGQGAAAGLALGAVAGAGYGWLIGWPIGAAIGGDDWRRVPLTSTP